MTLSIAIAATASRRNSVVVFCGTSAAGGEVVELCVHEVRTATQNVLSEPHRALGLYDQPDVIDFYAVCFKILFDGETDFLIAD